MDLARLGYERHGYYGRPDWELRRPLRLPAGKPVFVDIGIRSNLAAGMWEIRVVMRFEAARWHAPPFLEAEAAGTRDEVEEAAALAADLLRRRWAETCGQPARVVDAALAPDAWDRLIPSNDPDVLLAVAESPFTPPSRRWAAWGSALDDPWRAVPRVAWHLANPSAFGRHAVPPESLAGHLVMPDTLMRKPPGYWETIIGYKEDLGAIVAACSAEDAEVAVTRWREWVNRTPDLDPVLATSFLRSLTDGLIENPRVPDHVRAAAALAR